MSWFFWFGSAGSGLVAPNAPTGLAAVGLSPSSVRLTIVNGDTAVTYKVERRALPAGSFAEVAAGVTMPYTDTSGLAAATQYEYQIRGTNGAGDSPYSTPVSVFTQGNPPGSFGPPPRRRGSRPWGALTSIFPWRR